MKRGLDGERELASCYFNTLKGLYCHWHRLLTLASYVCYCYRKYFLHTTFLRGHNQTGEQAQHGSATANRVGTRGAGANKNPTKTLWLQGMCYCPLFMTACRAPGGWTEQKSVRLRREPRQRNIHNNSFVQYQINATSTQAGNTRWLAI